MSDFIGEQNDRLDQRQLAVFPTVMLLQEVYDRIERLEKERNKAVKQRDNLRTELNRQTRNNCESSRNTGSPFRHDMGE